MPVNDIHPFIVLSVATAVFVLLGYGLKLHLGIILPYVILCNPAVILHQHYMLEQLYTDLELSQMNINLDSFMWETWSAITLTFSVFSVVALIMRTTADVS